MKRLFVLMCVVLMFASCANDVSDDINDYKDNYCDGMTDVDGDGYYQKNVYSHGEIFDKLMSCDGEYILVTYQANLYDVLRVSDCQYGKIADYELLSEIECELLEEIPKEYDPPIVIN